MRITYGDIMFQCGVTENGNCPDMRHSISGGVVMMGEGATSRFCRVWKDTSVASPESEYLAAQIDEDNERAIHTVKKHFSSRRTRHVDVKHHIVFDAIEGGKVGIEHVHSEEQPYEGIRREERRSKNTRDSY